MPVQTCLEGVNDECDGSAYKGIKSDSGNYYWVFVGLMAVAGLVYCLVSWLIPKHDFVSEVSPAGA